MNPAPLPQYDLDSQSTPALFDALTPTSGELLSADVNTAVQDSPLTKAYYGGVEALSNTDIKYNNAFDYAGKVTAAALGYDVPRDNPQLTPEEANAKYWQPGMNKFSAPIHEEAAQIISLRQAQINKTNNTIDRANLSFGMGLVNNFATSALSLLDPSQDAMYFVPLVGEEEAYGRLAASLGKSFVERGAAATFRIAGEMTRGSLESNLVDYVSTAPFGQQKTPDQYAYEDLANVATATGLGVALKGIGKSFGLWSKTFGKLDPATQEHLKNSLSSEHPAEVNSVMDMDKNVNEVESQINEMVAKAMGERLDNVDLKTVSDALTENHFKVSVESVNETARDIGASEGFTKEEKQAHVAMLGKFVDAVNEYHGSEQYAKPDPNKIIHDTGEVTSPSNVNDHLAELHPAVDTVSNALELYRLLKSSKVTKISQKNSLEDRVKLLNDPNTPKTSAELRANGDTANADRVDKMGQGSQQDRALDVKAASDQGKLAPQVNPVQPDVKAVLKDGAPIADQSAHVNKQLNEVMKGHKDLVSQLDKDLPEGETSPEADALNEGIEKADEEITRVSGMKSLVNSAVDCALKNGLK